MKEEYGAWLSAQGYVPATVNMQTSRVLRLERSYGQIDKLTTREREDLVAELIYSVADARAHRSNPSKIDINGDLRTGLQSLKDAAQRYFRFLDDSTEMSGGNVGEIIEEVAERVEERQKLSLERDMQAFLRRNIESVEPGLKIVDDGAERFVESGRIDILCKDASGVLVVLELKAGTADARAIGQILGYMGDIACEEGSAVRGLLIAHDFDRRSRAAARAVSNLNLLSYAVSFQIVGVVG